MNEQIKVAPERMNDAATVPVKESAIAAIHHGSARSVNQVSRRRDPWIQYAKPSNIAICARNALVTGLAAAIWLMNVTAMADRSPTHRSA